MNFMQDYFSDQTQQPSPDPNVIDSIASNWLSADNSPETNASQLAMTQGVSPIAPTVAQQPNFFSSFMAGAGDVTSGVLKGAGQVASGIAAKLPETLLGMLSNKMGMEAKPSVGEDGKTVYYLSPATSGVPAQAAKPTAVISSGGGVAGIATSTVIFAIAGAALIYLIAKSR
jgi:hypothetical protein